MLRIRPEQQAVFDQIARQRFEDHLFEHCQQYWPAQVRADGEDRTRARIREVIERATNYGIIGQSDVARFIDLTFVWGDDFDVSPSTPWAADILNDESVSPSIKVLQLSNRTKEELAAREAPAKQRTSEFR